MKARGIAKFARDGAVHEFNHTVTNFGQEWRGGGGIKINHTSIIALNLGVLVGMGAGKTIIIV